MITKPGDAALSGCAVLTLGREGMLQTAQASMLAHISANGHGAVLFAHNTHADKPESLVSFDNEGRPLLVAFQETAVFRDVFNKI